MIRAGVVDEGRIITVDGVTSGLDVALWMVKRYDGPLLAQAVEERLE